jgi:hypothetical protein
LYLSIVWCLSFYLKKYTTNSRVRIISIFETLHFGNGWRSVVAQTYSLEGIHLCVASFERPVANENKLGQPRHHLSRRSLLRVWVRRRRIGSTLISLMQHFRIPLGASPILDWFFDGGCSHHLWPLSSVFLFSWWPPSASVFLAAHLACLRLGYMEWKKP